MAYSIISMRYELQQIAAARGVNPFQLEATKGANPYAFAWEATKGVVHPQLAARFPYGRRAHPLNDLLEYCWLVYSKAFYAAGPQLVGRVGDLWVPQQLSKAGISDTKTQTLWDDFTQGNIQVMDKWAPVVNDCWVLGGVHRKAEFDLVSVRTLQNLWDFKEIRHVVTARELLGLLHFGYKLYKEPDQVRLVCENPAAALAATIDDYGRYMGKMEAKGADAIRSILVMDPVLQSEIQNFQRGRLKHVTIPR